jgi:hypothetical protein
MLSYLQIIYIAFGVVVVRVRISDLKETESGYMEYLKYGVILLGNLTVKQRIVSSIFPEKLVFENKAYRTPKVNSAVGLLCRNSKDLGGGKKQSTSKMRCLSVW